MASYPQYPNGLPYDEARGAYMAQPQRPYEPARPDDSNHYFVTMEPDAHNGRIFRGIATPYYPNSYPTFMGIRPGGPINLTVNMSFPGEKLQEKEKGKEQAKENSKEKKSSPDFDVLAAKDASEHIVKMAHLKSSCEGNMQERLKVLTASQLREIILSACLKSKELTRRVTGWLDTREFGKDEYLGVRLQELRKGDLLKLVMWFYERDYTCSTQEITKTLVATFEERKTFVDLLF